MLLQARAEEALRRVGANSVEIAMEWLVLHPEEPAAAPTAAAAAAAAATAAAAAAAPAAAASEEEELSRALVASLAAIGMGPADVRSSSLPAAAGTAAAAPAAAEAAAATTPSAGTTAAAAAPAAPESGADAAAVIAEQPAPGPSTSAPTPTPEITPAPAPTTASAAVPAAAGASVPGPVALVDGAVSLLTSAPGSSFAVSDLLHTMCTRDDGKQRAAVVGRLLERLFGDAGADVAAAVTRPAREVLTPARLLLLLLKGDAPSKELAAEQQLAPKALSMLEAWWGHYAAGLEALPNKDNAEARRALLEVPVWVEALLLLLDVVAGTKPAAKTAGGARAGAAGGPGAAAGGPGAAAGSVPAAAEQPPQLPGAAAGNPAAAAQQAAAGQAAGAEAAASAAAAAAGAAAAAAAPAGLPALLATWRPCGLLSEAEQARALSLSMSLLRALHAHADEWDRPAGSMYEDDSSVPSPSATTQALLQLLVKLTARHANAQGVLAKGGHRLLLSLPGACLAPTYNRQEALIGAVLRHILEDPSTLEGWMEAEIRNYMSVKGRAAGVRDMYGRPQYGTSTANPNSRWAHGTGSYVGLACA